MTASTIRKIKKALCGVIVSAAAVCVTTSFGTVNEAEKAEALESESYYAVLSGVSPEGESADINGSKAYLLTEYDSRYVSGKYFIGDINTSTRYSVYCAEKTVVYSNEKSVADEESKDDEETDNSDKGEEGDASEDGEEENNSSEDGEEEVSSEKNEKTEEDTTEEPTAEEIITYRKVAEGTVTEADVGYYTFNYDPSKIYSEGAYAEMVETDYGGWYFCSNLNGYLYNSSGNLNLPYSSAFREVDEDDPEYSRVYKQYKYNITVEEADLAKGDVTFCITNGKSVYKAGDIYGVISEVGIYRIIFCENRIYDSGYHYSIGEKNSTPSADTDYYLCLSNQDYAILPSNRLDDIGGYEYTIENISLSSSVKFYVCDENGSKWYGSDGEEMSVSSQSAISYDIKFSPSKVYSSETEWENTSCHITYKLYSPESYSLSVNSYTYSLSYNSTVTDYDEYYISSMYLYSGDSLSVSGYENGYTVTKNGYYRILFTPGETKSGDYYCFNDEGSYGTGSEYEYNLYVEKAPQYYAVFECDVASPPSSDAVINGKAAYLLSRDEASSVEVYTSDEFFIGEKEFNLKARIYEYITSSSSYNEIVLYDDTVGVEYVDWYTLSFYPSGDAYITASKVDKIFGGYYIAGNFNNYLYTSSGEENLSSDYRFTKIDEDDDDYNEDYEQYILYVEVSAKVLKNGEFSFYITDGADKFTNGGDYITLAEAGRYKILFSPEHIYGRGRYYRYTLESSSVDKEDLEISTAAEFLSFAEECNADADYSVGLNVYITSDIDFAGVDFIEVKLFCGYFNGGYHVFDNITVEGDGDGVGIFVTLAKGAVVERLTVKNMNVSAEESDKVGFVAINYGSVRYVKTYGSVFGDSYVGGMVGYNGRSAVESSDTVEDSSEAYVYAKIEKCYSECNVSGKVNVGGIAGYSGGKIISCTFAGGSNDVYHSSSDRIVNVGGVVGYSTGVVDSCVNEGSVGYENTGVYVGGIVGFSAGEIYFSKNTASVFGNAYTGGAVGYLGALSDENSSDSLTSYFGGMDYEEFIKTYFSDDGDDFTVEADGGVYVIVYCINSGDITAESYAGGIAGRVTAPSGTTVNYTSSTSSDGSASSTVSSVAASVRIDGCVNSGDVFASAGDYAGGIAAYQNSGEIVNCLSAGEIKAEGVSSGEYVGGIAGYGSSISYSASFCSLSGSDYIGGIAGYAAGTLKGSYSDCSVLTPDALHTGLIAGYCEAYNPATGDFNDKVADNFFVGDNGGVDGMNYGAPYDNAAHNLTAEQLVSVDNLSPYLTEGFSSDNWCASLYENGYPVLKAFEEAVECSSYGAEEDFGKSFDKAKEEFSKISQKYCVRSYTVTFLEWNEDDGDLFDDDGNVNKDNFDVVAILRLRYGEKITYPSFTHAEAYGDGYIYNGDKASYFVSWAAADLFASEKTLVYASYKEISTTLSDVDGLILVEGKFEEDETVEVEYSGEYFTVKFYKNGTEEAEKTGVRVKILVDNPEKATLYKVEGKSLVKTESAVSGRYVSFEFNGGYYYIEESGVSFPTWAFALIGAGGALVVCGMAATIVYFVKKRDKNNAKDADED